jgi:hypothetical protein
MWWLEKKLMEADGRQFCIKIGKVPGIKRMGSEGIVPRILNLGTRWK